MRLALIAAALVSTLASTASAQTALDLTPGAARARPAAASRAPEFFRFVGEPGQTVRLTVTGPGVIEGQLYEPQGAPMLAASGEGKLTLEAILPADGVYLFSVVRAVPANPYSIALAVQAADPYFAHFSESIGYTIAGPDPTGVSTACWVEPGARFRVTQSSGITTVVTLGRGSKLYYHQSAPSGQSRDFESDTVFEGDEAVTTFRGMSQGEIVQRRKVLERQGTWTYSGYACPPGAAEISRPNPAATTAPAPAPAVKAPAADQTPRLTVDPAQATSFAKPLSVRAGELIASDISDNDYSVGPEWRAEHFTFSGRAGEVITAQVRSDIPTLEVIIRDNNRTGKALVEGPAQAAPLRLTLPKDGEYFLIVHAKGPQRVGKYLLSLGSGGNAPPLEAVQVAVVSKPAAVTLRTTDPAQAVDYLHPHLIRAGELVASDISENDVHVGLNRRLEPFLFTGRAGEVVSAEVRSDLPEVEIVIITQAYDKVLARGDAKAGPLRATLPKDGAYFVAVSASGRQKTGKYLLSFGSGGNAPPFEAAPVVNAAVAPPLPAIPGVTSIASGQTATRPAAGADGAVEMFQILAGFGAKLHAVANGSGPLEMRLYTPEGSQMLAVEGVGTATLDAYLPRDGIYFVSVARRNAYTLTISAEEPALPDALFALNVGYEIKNPQGQLVYTCWLEPGRKVRTINPSLKLDLVSSQPGPGKIRFEGVTQGKPVTIDVARHMEGDVLIYESDASTTMRTPVDNLALRTGGTWKGYICP